MESITDQPPPTQERPGLPAVWDLVRADMQERDALGRERYGTPLQPFNGRKPLVDAYQEILDLAVYLRQELHEAEELRAEVASLRNMVDTEAPHRVRLNRLMGKTVPAGFPLLAEAANEIERLRFMVASYRRAEEAEAPHRDRLNALVEKDKPLLLEQAADEIERAVAEETEMCADLDEAGIPSASRLPLRVGAVLRRLRDAEAERAKARAVHVGVDHATGPDRTLETVIRCGDDVPGHLRWIRDGMAVWYDAGRMFVEGYAQGRPLSVNGSPWVVGIAIPLRSPFFALCDKLSPCAPVAAPAPPMLGDIATAAGRFAENMGALADTAGAATAAVEALNAVAEEMAEPDPHATLEQAEVELRRARTALADAEYEYSAELRKAKPLEMTLGSLRGRVEDSRAEYKRCEVAAADAREAARKAARR